MKNYVKIDKQGIVIQQCKTSKRILDFIEVPELIEQQESTVAFYNAKTKKHKKKNTTMLYQYVVILVSLTHLKQRQQGLQNGLQKSGSLLPKKKKL